MTALTYWMLSELGHGYRRIRTLARCLCVALIGWAGELPEVVQAKPIIAPPVAEAVTPFVFPPKNIIEFRVAIEPEHELALLEIDAFPDGHSVPEQAADSRAGLPWHDNPMFRHVLGNDVVNRFWKVALKQNELMAELFENGDGFSSIYKEISDAWSVNLFIKHCMGFIPHPWPSDDLRDGACFDLGEEMRHFGTHERFGAAVSGVGSAATLDRRFLRVLGLPARYSETGTELNPIRLPQLVGGPPQGASEASNSYGPQDCEYLIPTFNDFCHLSKKEKGDVLAGAMLFIGLWIIVAFFIHINWKRYR